MVRPYTAGKRILSQWNDLNLDAAWQEQKLNCTGYVRSSNEGVLNWASLLRACYQMSTGSLCWPGWKHQVIFENIKLPINAPNTSSSWLHSIMFFTLGDQGSACNIRCDMSSCVSYFFPGLFNILSIRKTSKSRANFKVNTSAEPRTASLCTRLQIYGLAASQDPRTCSYKIRCSYFAHPLRKSRGISLLWICELSCWRSFTKLLNRR